MALVLVVDTGNAAGFGWGFGLGLDWDFGTDCCLDID
jgi:hypothetical protein